MITRGEGYGTGNQDEVLAFRMLNTDIGLYICTTFIIIKTHPQSPGTMEHEFSDEALRAAARAARAARGNDRGNAGGHNDRKRPRRNDEHCGAGKARRRIFPATNETAQRLFGALTESTAKPICEGGLATYFIAEAHRRAAMLHRPRPRAASAPMLAVFDLIAAASRKEGRPAGGDCPVCMQDASSDTIALPCGHAFHKRCIVSWLQVNSSCPCCRAPVPASEPYSYPAKTKLQNPLLRTRVEGFRLDMREVALRTLHIEGMQGAAGMVCLFSRAMPLDPPRAQLKQTEEEAAAAAPNGQRGTEFMG